MFNKFDYKERNNKSRIFDSYFEATVNKETNSLFSMQPYKKETKPLTERCPEVRKVLVKNGIV